MNEEFPWLIVAMVVVAFFRWVILKLQGKSVTDTFDESQFAENEEERERTASELQNRADPTIDPNEEIRKFFRELGGDQGIETPPPVPKAAPAVAPPPLPPPLREPVHIMTSATAARPPGVKKVSKPELSPLEETALRRLQERGGLQARQRRSKAAHGTATGGVTFRDLIAHPQSLKTAVILKEILDKPKGLVSLDEFHG